MKKKVDLKKIGYQLAGIRSGLRGILREVWDGLPEDPDGFETDKEEFVNLGVHLYDAHLYTTIKDYTNGTIDQDSFEPVPDEPSEPEVPGWRHVKTLPWKGDPGQVPMPNSAQGQYMGFDRVWYSCTDDPCRTIVRQVEIPDGVLPSSGQAYFVFSDGNESLLTDVSASTKYLKTVKGNGRGIKFVKGKPSHPYIHDRRSDIAFAEGSKAEWVKIYLR